MKEATLKISFPESLPLKPEEKPKQIAKTYTQKELLEKTLAYFDGDELATNVWINKYSLKDSDGNFYECSPDDMHQRMASEIARIEKKYPNPLSKDEVYRSLKEFKYIVPQGGSMTGIGNPFQIASLSNCFVIGNRGDADSYGAIMKIDEEQVQLMKRRGGVGHDLSHIRPKKSPVKNSALTSTGVVPFMERYSHSTREVAQDGRRGALMLSISIKHPDVEDFIDVKLDGKKVTGANVSVRIDDEFMKAVESDTTYTLQYPVESENPGYKTTIHAKKLWQKIIHNAWESGEPGILFWDTIINESIPDCYSDFSFKTVSTNPCGEIPLCPYDSCRLVAINLFNFVENPFTPKASFNFDLFKNYVRIGQRIMDDIVDLEVEKIDGILEKIDNDPQLYEIKRTELSLCKKIKNKCLEGRRTGLGITAEGDMLAALGLRYASEEAIQFSENIHKTLAIAAYRSSVEMAQERGAFPIFDPKREEKNPFINRIKKEDEALYNQMLKNGRRNIALLTVAPTGPTSLMTQTTSGIEPVFMISYKRRTKINSQAESTKVDFTDETGDQWEEHNVFHKNFLTWLKTQGIGTNEASLLDDVSLNELIKKSPYNKATAGDVDWISKVRMQGTIQKWVDHSISVTVNVPNDVQEELISDIYLTAWKNGCKGITVYRDGSRSGVLVSDKDNGKHTNYFSETKPPKRPISLEAKIVRFQNNHEKWIAVVGILNERPYEIFTGKAEDSLAILSAVDNGWVLKNRTDAGVTRYDFQYEDRDGYKITIEGLSRSFDKEYWNYAKLISGILRHGMPLIFVVNLVSNLNLDGESLNTWKNGVIRALKKFIPDGTTPTDDVCPECRDHAMVYEEGCLSCKSCGYTKCE
ncbi:MAG: adenosylcobalamin-dependent ribonucleoside-diphosphate reductase [Bacteroidetes bacterium]|nr:adenosylcobalamin-dependent ribonucleoside-diphosphate reductase [Bacteroidota bacterium]MDA1121106.1 adenosylcobalamin-dependent ribonucleoside-diphosphate reductase [Bacteroidota bacterium]